MSIVATASPRTATSIGSNLVSPALEVTSLRLVVGNVGLGSGDQFGCIDCSGGEIGGEEGSARAPALVAVPVGSGAVQLRTELASPGTYPAIELELVLPAPHSVGSTWPADRSIEITGRYNGMPFSLGLSVAGTSRHTLDAPIVVRSLRQETVVATISFPVDQWFAGPVGSLDPANASMRAQIEANIKAWFAASEST